MSPVTCCYVSCGSNCVPNSVCWGRNGTICYGGCRAIVLCHTKPEVHVSQTVVGHSDRVNCVRWIPQSGKEYESELVSCSTDKTLCVWKLTQNQLSLVCCLRGHTASVNCVSGVSFPTQTDDVTLPRTLLASASADSSVRIWQREQGQDEFVCIQTLLFGTGFMFDVTWTLLTSEQNTPVPLLACGGDDHKIHLFSEEGDQFSCVQKLSGHEDWIRCLEFTHTDDGCSILASCCQEGYIRLWRLKLSDGSTVTQNIQELSLDEDIHLKDITINIKHTSGEVRYTVNLESVLQGHENWIYSVHWQPQNTGKESNTPCLLSASMDKTMIIWKPDSDTGLWTEEVRVGHAGGNTLGFFGGVWGPDGRSILAHGYHGAFHMWHQQDGDCWSPGVTVGGHYSSVEDISWEPHNGRFLLSLSTDQTTRLHAYWHADNIEQSGWYETARPQVHGYDMQCIASLGSYCFASGADEKVLRVFQAPRNFIENLGRICKVDVENDLKESCAEGASVPALGLSNKAVFAGESATTYDDKQVRLSQNDQYADIYFAPISTSEPPTEENLLQNTLWPEVQKLYGHGYEIYAVAAHPDGTLLASACKAAKAEHACVILWDGRTWQQLQSLPSHTHTVTQLAFSHSGQRLLSVSRDRTWTVWQRNTQDDNTETPLYSRLAYSTDKTPSTHSRIIWGCAWSHDDKYFITVARDKKAIIWGEDCSSSVADGKSASLGPYRVSSVLTDINEPITAVHMAPVHVNKTEYLVALGTDSGSLHVYRWQPCTQHETAKWTQAACHTQNEAHHLTVKRVKFSPVVGDINMKVKGQTDKGQEHLHLATCGADHIVKIYSVDLDSL